MGGRCQRADRPDPSGECIALDAAAAALALAAAAPRCRGRLVSAGVLVVAGLTAVITVVGSASPDESTPISALVTESTSAAPEPETAPAAVETPWCAGRTSGQPVPLDSSDPGLAAIAGFENAYYVDRDGFRARSFVADNARVGSAEQIGQGIAQIPVGTEHCVLAARVSDGVYAVDLFERRPDTTSEHYRQTITTAPAPQARSSPRSVHERGREHESTTRGGVDRDRGHGRGAGREQHRSGDCCRAIDDHQGCGVE
ncbi:hypothetical protein GS539_21385 [Rhodococcus hoagii]|nr:hypothetical protein [Prescottella equi]